MDPRTWLGTLAEARVVAALVEQQFDVFRSTLGKAPFDLVASKTDQLLRVEVKGTAQGAIRGAYQIRLASTRSNRTRNVIHPFSAGKSDVLAVYIQPLDTDRRIRTGPDSGIDQGPLLTSTLSDGGLA